jgi:hypothetical protein
VDKQEQGKNMVYVGGVEDEVWEAKIDAAKFTYPEPGPTEFPRRLSDKNGKILFRPPTLLSGPPS